MSILNRLGLFTRRQLHEIVMRETEQANGDGYYDGFIAGCKDAGVQRGPGGRFCSVKPVTLGRFPALSKRDREERNRIESP